MNSAKFPKVSVFIVTYQQKDFIDEAISSALNQEYPNLEIIIGDDGSTDGTQDVLKEYASKYPALIKLVLSSENTGITKNCNRVLKACTGDYIAFLPGDDIWLPDKITTQVNFMEAHPECAISYHNVEIFNSDTGEILGLYNGPGATYPYEGTVDVAVKHGTFNGALSCMVRHSDCPAHGFDERVPVASDWLFWIEVLLNGGQIRYIDEVLGKYRRHTNNVTESSQLLKNFKDHLKSLDYILKREPLLRKEVFFRRKAIFKYLVTIDTNLARKLQWYIASIFAGLKAK